MTTTRLAGAKSPAWIRALQIGIGAVAIGLSISAMIYPALAVVATFTAAAIILMLIGIEQIITGVFVYKESRYTHIGLGALIVVLSSIVMVYPIGAATLVVLLAAIALLLSGIASLLLGLRSKSGKDHRPVGKGTRALLVGAGGLAIALSIAIMISPTFGIGLAGFLIGIALLVYGARLVVAGASGRAYSLTSGPTDSMAA